MFYDMEAEIKCSTEIKDIYTLCGVDSSNKTLTVITYYTDNDNAEEKTVNIDFSKFYFPIISKIIHLPFIC